MDALVDANRDARSSGRALARTRKRREPLEIVMRQRLFDERKTRATGGLDIAARVCEREPAIGVGAERYMGSECFAHRKRCRDLVCKRFHADLELEEAETLRELRARL